MEPQQTLLGEPAKPEEKFLGRPEHLRGRPPNQARREPEGPITGFDLPKRRELAM
jgi:hypothetical protein